MTDAVKELLKYLHLGSRLDLKDYALTQVLALTGSEDGLKLIASNAELLTSLLALLDDNSETISKQAALALVNVSADEAGATALVELDPASTPTNRLLRPPDDVVRTVLRHVLDKAGHLADPCCMILSNLTRGPRHVETVIKGVEKAGVTFDVLVNAFTKTKYNEKGATLHYLGPVLSNLSQSPTVRRYLLDREKCVVQRLVAFTEYEGSVVRRGGVVGTLRNCCFEDDSHGWLLGPEVDVLPRLLLPLAGNTEYDDEDNDKLPPELQYLPEDKKREEDPDIRCMLLEAITQLCASKPNREYVRDKNTYVILRELHKWETDRKALLACENLVDILIRTEEEIGKDNIKEVEVPEDLVEKFAEMDSNFVADR